MQGNLKCGLPMCHQDDNDEQSNNRLPVAQVKRLDLCTATTMVVLVLGKTNQQESIKVTS